MSLFLSHFCGLNLNSWAANNITVLPISRGGTGNNTGLVAQATKLANSPKIDGITFDGTQDISLLTEKDISGSSVVNGSCTYTINYFEFSNGLIFQYGQGIISGNNYCIINFKLNFSNTLYSAHITRNLDSVSAASNGEMIRDKTATSMTVDTNAGRATKYPNFTWSAIGH